MTSIEWTHKTINPIHLVKEDGSHGGHWCKKISQGCANCYAEEMNNSNYFKFASHLSYTGNPPDNLIYDRQMLIKNTKTKTSSLIFLGSMTDLLGDWIPDEWILDIIAIAKRSLHVFQFLTKRPERMKEVFGK
ncbi:MAG TPA: hypothetical protein DDZ41_10215, partial [Flavobacterium sp.]|nr:hypothetical protein [Flavobacterium sp.]